MTDSLRLIPPFQVGDHVLESRLVLGTGRYETFEVMRDSLAASQTHCITVAVRRERLYDGEGRNILDYIDLDRYTLLPNTAGCYDAPTAVRCKSAVTSQWAFPICMRIARAFTRDEPGSSSK